MRIRQFIREQIRVIKQRDPSIKRTAEVFLYPSFRALCYHKITHRLYRSGHFFAARILAVHATRRTGIEIHPGAVIGEGVFIDHGMGVVIGETAIVGHNVTIYQGVTLGGTGKDRGKRHPTIENNVMISAGAKILGNIRIGSNAKIGAGSVVLKDVPPRATVVGVPGKVVKIDDRRIDHFRKLDHGNLPDINYKNYCALCERLKVLEEKIDDKNS
ncbi:MAG: serine O-acetyltransferase EpsC [Eubacteriales bacterium]|nr:serine O-acetyltransferase EpsC [Eubacteriales bacterium]